jgi:hypothetical protein
MARMLVWWWRRGQGNHFARHLIHQTNAIHHDKVDSKIKSVDLEKKKKTFEEEIFNPNSSALGLTNSRPNRR